MPVLASSHHGGQAVVRLHLFVYGVLHALLFGLAASIEAFHLYSQIPGRLPIVRHQQLIGLARRVHASGGVDARSKEKTEVPRRERRNAAGSVVEELPQPNGGARAEYGESLRDDDAVLPSERHQVGHGGESRQH